MTKQVRAPNGEIINFPDNMSDEAIARVMRDYTQTQSRAAPQRLGRDEAFGRAFDDALFFNTTDENDGRIAQSQWNSKQLITAAGDFFRGDFARARRRVDYLHTPEAQQHRDNIRRTATEQSRARQQQLRTEHPVTSFGAGLVGGTMQAVATGGGGTALVKQVAPRLATGVGAQIAARPIMASAIAGGGQGALYGAGDATEGNRLQGAGQGFVMGSALGAAAPVVGRGLQIGGQRLLNRTGLMPINPEQTAARNILGSIDENDLLSNMVALQRAGLPNVNLSDASPRLARRVGAVARGGMDETRELAARRGSAAVSEVPAYMAQSTRRLSANPLTVEQRTMQGNANVDKIQGRLMRPIEDINLDIAPISLNTMRTPRMSSIVRDTANTIQSNAMRDGTPPVDAATLRDILDNNFNLDDVFAPARAPSAPDLMANSQHYRQTIERLSGLADEATPDAMQGFSWPNTETSRVSIIDRIRRAGGLRDRRVNDLRNLPNGRVNIGELETILGSNNRIPGLINNQNGRDADELARGLQSEGYFGENVRLADNMDSVGGDVGSNVLYEHIQKYLADPEYWKYGNHPEYQNALQQFRRQSNTAPNPRIEQAASELNRQLGGDTMENVAKNRAIEEYYSQGMGTYDNLPQSMPSWAGASNNPTAPLPQGEVPRLSIRGAEELRRRLSAATSRAYDKGDNALGRDLRLDQDAIMAPFRAASPRYNSVLDIGRKMHTEIDAMAQGGDILNNAIPNADIAQTFASMTDRQKRGFRLGAAQRLSAQFPDTRINEPLINAMASRSQMQDRLGSVFGVDKAKTIADKSNAALRRLHSARAINPNVGSQTAERNIEEQLLQGEWVPRSGRDAAAKVLGAVVREVGGLTPAERTAIVDLATRPIDGNGLQALQRLKALANAKGRQLPPIVDYMIVNGSSQMSGRNYSY